MLTIKKELQASKEPIRREIQIAVKSVLRLTLGDNSSERQNLINWLNRSKEENNDRFSSHLYSQSEKKVGNISPAPI